MDSEHVTTDQTTSTAMARQRLMEDLKTLTKDAEELMKVTAGEVSEKARIARERLAVGLDRAKATYQDLQQQGMENAKAAARKADVVIREHPYQSLGIAFGVGLLIGVLAIRK